ncbi:ABC transporter permease [Saccharopolyspora hirsuta]|uniref:ABC transporter permease n=1 Tax=Saccharopolyspora hirsuta TaxID=1837 RepID=A0A5M7C898_SACHI|nr:ABC transporter permease [Saccharopolyspora hirsuta]KAA5834545.1 ABC transporter permease [Saccharopolyspora hirsuta]
MIPRRGLVGALVVGVVFAAGLAAPLLAPFAPETQVEGANLLGPSAAHWFGTDELNRDVLSRVLHGIRVDLLISFAAVPLGALTGIAVGVASTAHRVLDVVVQRALDVLLAFPNLILAIALTAVLGPGLSTIFAVVVAVEIPVFARLVRSEVLRVRELEFVTAAEVIGARRGRILRTHVVPNSVGPLIVQTALSMSIAVFLEGAMSFLGLGVRPPEPSLGSTLNGSLNYLDANPAYAVGPLLVIAALVLGFQLIAQAASAATRTGERTW